MQEIPVAKELQVEWIGLCNAFAWTKLNFIELLHIIFATSVQEQITDFLKPIHPVDFMLLLWWLRVSGKELHQLPIDVTYLPSDQLSRRLIVSRMIEN